MIARPTELRNEIAVLARTATALGVGQKGMEGVSRMALSRATSGKTRRLKSLQRTHQALMELVLRYFRRDGFAGSGGANAFADAMLLATLRLYARVKTELAPKRALTPFELRLIVEEVLVPTAFAILSSSRCLGFGAEIHGLGCEFHGPKSWYLPDDARPLTAILDRWLKVAGFRTPCGFSRDSTNLKTQVSRWMAGDHLPSIEDLDALVERYKDRVDWLDDAAAWKARLRLARTLQSLWAEAGKYFAAHRLPSLKSPMERFETINGDQILRDADGLLASPQVFFAVRLVQLRLKQEGKLAAAIQPPRTQYARGFPPSASDEHIARWQARIQKRLDIGYRFARFLARRGGIALGSELSRPSLHAVAAFEEHLFRLGLGELKRLRTEKRPAR
jgi:hypothetical protein